MIDEPKLLRAGVVGLGMMGRNHVRVWDEAVPGVELVAVADPDAAAVERATAGRRARGYGSAERIVARRRAGKHIFYSLADSHVSDLIQSAIDHAADRH